MYKFIIRFIYKKLSRFILFSYQGEWENDIKIQQSYISKYRIYR